MSLGVHFALPAADARRLRAIKEPDELCDHITGTLEESYLEEGTWAYQSDKAWEAIHRCLTGGQLLYATGPFPLAYAILGGDFLDAGDDYTACLITPKQARETSEALDRLNKAWFRQRYEGLAETEYSRYMSQEDLEYTWENFKGLRAFFRRAVSARRFIEKTFLNLEQGAGNPFVHGGQQAPRQLGHFPSPHAPRLGCFADLVR